MNKLIIGILVAVIIAGGVYLFTNKGNYNVPTTAPIKNEPGVVVSSPTPTATSGPTVSQTQEVMITRSGFSPSTLTVKVGTKVVWVNKSGVTAAVNSAVHPTHLVYPPLNLGEVANGSSVELVFDKPGTYKYHNHLNPTQTGTIVVQ